MSSRPPRRSRNDGTRPVPARPAPPRTEPTEVPPADPARDDRDVALNQWAAALAASLPPLTRAEAAPIGQLAAVLDARCAQAAPQAEERRAA
ncbi:hypothetical protein [Amycolatopsis sp. DSM 110486]|uniref:hypothetical protein n=1 Tax=Amycolatopsis sp. DSM 110486 TaxID=2865832 RepID=UPI001C6A4095|nr:hypothetical protein [Amycolatopsis sp. DSM 110486]QYN21017.1 hypothetical protein K1T34_00010 [Amycolatopsis sp. DSM 110486]